MSSRLRVLVVDDSVVVRRMLSEMLASNPAIESVSTAANGKIALARIRQGNPDAIVLDVEMPEMDGLQTVAELRRFNKTLPIIMFSTVTARGASATFDAIALGANDYVTKPSTRSGTVGQLGLVYQELVDKIKAHCHYNSTQVNGYASHTHPSIGSASSIPAPPPSSVPGVHLPVAKPVASGPVEAIAIGVSTGGPNALMTLFAALPAELAVPVFIVQHMPPLFTRLFAERLSASGRIPVQEGRPGAMVEPGMAWIAPGGYHMVVQRAGAAICLKTNLEAPENSCRPAADVLFRSVAAVYGKHVLAVVMTGMGQDGLRGCEAIRREGGQIVVQDEASSVVWGMPGFVARAGLADKIVPLGELAAEIVRRTHPAQAPAEVGSPATARASL